MAIAGLLRRLQFRRHRIDDFAFSKRDSSPGLASAFLVLHVGDIPICDSDDDLLRFRADISKAFRAWPLIFVEESTPLVLRGLQLVGKGTFVMFPQES